MASKYTTHYKLPLLQDSDIIDAKDISDGFQIVENVMREGIPLPDLRDDGFIYLKDVNTNRRWLPKVGVDYYTQEEKQEILDFAAQKAAELKTNALDEIEKIRIKAEGSLRTATAEITAAREAAEAAKSRVESAEQAAQSAKNAAEEAKSVATNAQTGAQTAMSAAQKAAENASSSQTAAEQSAQNAESSNTAAQVAKAQADKSAKAASSAQAAAESAQSQASASAASASNAASEASGSKAAAERAAEQAANSQQAALTSASAASSSLNFANQAQQAAEKAASEAATSKAGADEAKTSAEQARDTAVEAANNAVAQSNVPLIANNLTETEAGKTLDATQGKILDDKIAATKNSIGGLDKLSTVAKSSLVAAVNELAGDKVDKVEGKGLSTVDFTLEKETKLASIENGANKTAYSSSLNSTDKSKAATPYAIKTINDAKVDKVAGKGLSPEEFTSEEKSKLGNLRINGGQFEYRDGITWKQAGKAPVDNLTSTDASSPLSANQGRVINSKLGSFTDPANENATSLWPVINALKVSSGGSDPLILALMDDRLQQSINKLIAV